MASANQFQFTEIGARLRAYRLGKGISPEDLADRIGISRAALYRAEKGEIRKIDTLTSIAEGQSTQAIARQHLADSIARISAGKTRRRQSS